MEAMTQPIAGQTNIASGIGDTKLDTILSLDELAKRSREKLETLKDDLKKAKLSFDSALEGHEDYRTAAENLKVAQKLKREAKQQAMNNPALIKLAADLDELRMQKKEVQISLSDYILEYEAQTQQLPLFGDEYVVVKSATVKKIRMRK